MVEVSADSHVGIEQVIGPPLVRYPAGVEEHMPARKPEPGRKGPELGGDRHLRHGRVGVAQPQEHQAQVRHPMTQAVNRLQQRDRVEPVVHSPTPEDHLVVRAYPGQCAPQPMAVPARWFAGQPVGHDRNELLEEGVGLVVVRVDPPQGRQGPEPEVPLALAGTGEEVAAAQGDIDDPGLAGHGHVVRLGVAAPHLEVLKVGGVVNVHCHRLVRLLQLLGHVHQRAGGEANIGAVDQLGQSGAGRQAQLGVGVGAGDRHRARQDHVHVLAQDMGQVPRPDGRTRHLGADGVGREHHGPAPVTLPGCEVVRHRREATCPRHP